MKLKTKIIFALSAVVIALLPLSILAQDDENTEEQQNFYSLLMKFEMKGTAEAANDIIDAIRQEMPIENPVHFTADMPIDTMQQQVYYWSAEYFYDKQKYDHASKMAQSALPFFHPSNDSRADCLSLLGVINIRMGDFNTAAFYAKQCLEMDMKSGDDDLISSSMNTVAAIYMAANQATTAEEYILGALQHSEKVNNPPRRAVILGTASEIYHKIGDDNSALAYAEQAYKIDSLLGREPQMSIRLSQKGYALIGLQRYKEAEKVFRQVLPTLHEAGDRHSYAIVLNNMGTALRLQNRPRQAIPYYREASAIFSNMGDLYNEIHSHRGLYESYWHIDPDSAKIELEHFNALKDSLYSHSTAEALSRYNAEFGNDRLQKENTEIREKQQRTLNIAILVLVVILAAAWIIILQLRRRHQHRMHKLMTEIEKLRSSADEVAAPIPAAETAAPAPDDEPEKSVEDKLFLQTVVKAANAAMANGRLSVEQIASDMNMGVQSFRRRLQSAAGETPKTFFTAIQMERAASLLTQDPDIPVSQVALLCGFENLSSFSHTFKRMYDCSPSQFRESPRP